MVAQSLEPLLLATTSNLSLDARQLEVSKALHEKSPDLQLIYLGGLWVKIQAENPDRLALAAHSFRELMEKLPRILAVPQKALKESTNSQIEDLRRTKWEVAVRKSDARSTSGEWSGAIDGPLKAFLAGVQDFFNWFEQVHPRRRAAARETLRTLDPYMGVLPPAIGEFNVRRWIKTQDFFVGISHHRRCAEEEFNGWQFALEQQLADALSPRTFADLDEIDSLIAEGESGA